MNDSTWLEDYSILVLFSSFTLPFHSSVNLPSLLLLLFLTSRSFFLLMIYSIFVAVLVLSSILFIRYCSTMSSLLEKAHVRIRTGNRLNVCSYSIQQHVHNNRIFFTLLPPESVRTLLSLWLVFCTRIRLWLNSSLPFSYQPDAASSIFLEEFFIRPWHGDQSIIHDN